jgi:hypothetical protein
MSTKQKEDAMERTTRWMVENLTGAYNAVHPQGHPHAGEHCTNSATLIIVFCYMDGLGKVLLKDSASKNFEHFRKNWGQAWKIYFWVCECGQLQG